MKKVLAISSVLLGVVFLAGCGQQPVSQTQPTTPAPVAQTPTQPVATQPINETASWKVYTNKTDGYQITFPDSWNGYQTISSGLGGVEFGGWKSSDGVYPFTLSVMSKKDYEKDQEIKYDEPKMSVYVGETNNQHVILCDGVCCKGAPIVIFNDFAKARCVEVPAILKTFQIAK